MSSSLPSLLAVAGAVLGLALLVVLVLVLRDREATLRRVRSLFRRPPRPAKVPGPDHYYKPYWS